MNEDPVWWLWAALRDINNDGVVRCTSCSDMDREVGCQMADAMIGRTDASRRT